MVAVAWLLSMDRKRFPWRTVWWGLGLQMAFALVIIKTEFGRLVFEWAQAAVNRVTRCASEGAKRGFGPLADEKLLANALGPQNVFIFVVSVSATIIVVSALS